MLPLTSSKSPQPFLREASREIDGGGGFSDPAFLIGDRDFHDLSEPRRP
jgi:hypothetical protein